MTTQANVMPTHNPLRRDRKGAATPGITWLLGGPIIPAKIPAPLMGQGCPPSNHQKYLSILWLHLQKSFGMSR